MLSSLSVNPVMPPRYSGVKYEDIPKVVLGKLKKALNANKGLYLWGECGTGKTHIAYAIMRRCIENRRSAKMYNSPEMFDMIREYYGRSFDYRDDELRRLVDFDGLLIIDDIGAEKPTDWVAETFYKIVNVRYEKMLTTIFTSNLSLDKLAEKIGDRVPSRIVEMCEVVKLEGDDKRLH